MHGCDNIDVGARVDPSRGGSRSEAEELARIEPVLAELARALDVPVSVDTYKSTVAARASSLAPSW
jgi:dihydropteroate synthase